jgi:hypothetical protein
MQHKVLSITDPKKPWVFRVDFCLVEFFQDTSRDGRTGGLPYITLDTQQHPLVKVDVSEKGDQYLIQVLVRTLPIPYPPHYSFAQLMQL